MSVDLHLHEPVEDQSMLESLDQRTFKFRNRFLMDSHGWLSLFMQYSVKERPLLTLANFLNEVMRVSFHCCSVPFYFHSCKQTTLYQRS